MKIQDELIQKGKGKGLEKAPGQRRKYQDEIISKPAEPSSPAPTTPTQSPTSNDLRSLAERYVNQYETNAGKTLSSGDRQALVQNVYTFYSEPSRAGRLEKVVLA